MKTVTILIDVSLSMVKPSGDNQIIPIDEAIGKALEIIKRQPSDCQIILGGFAATLGQLDVVDHTSASQTLSRLRAEAISENPPQGAGTNLFDCSADAAQKFAENYQEHAKELFVLTDGDDQSSKIYRSWESLDSILKSLGVKLTVVNVGTSSKVIPAGTTVTQIQIADAASLFKNTAVQSTQVEYVNLSFPIICLDSSVTQEAISAISNRYRQVVPYLENLTGLRYYPVPTVIVDEAAFNKLDKTHNDSEPNFLYNEAFEMLHLIAFFYHDAFGYNKDCKPDYFIQPFWIDEKGNSQTDCNATNFLGWTRGLAEGGLSHYAREYIKNGVWAESYSIKLNSLNYLKSLELITKTWQIAAEKDPKKIIQSSSCLGEVGISCRSFPQGIVADLAKLINIEKYIDPNLWGCGSQGKDWHGRPLQKWHIYTNLKQYATMMGGLAEWVKRQVQMRSMIQTDSGNEDLIKARETFIRIARPYGFYSRRSDAPNGLPEPAASLNMRSGIVVLCAKPILEAVNKMSLTIGNKTADIFGSILAHEHFHAIIEEGLPTRGSRPSDGAKAIEESLAEWVQIDFDRNNPIMKDWCVAHALSGVFPQWPYAGAIFVEKLVGNKKDTQKAVRKIIEKYRKDAETASSGFIKYADKT